MRSALVFCLTIILAASFAFGCAHSRQFNKALKSATKKGRLYDANTWNAEIIWHATFFDNDFRREFAQEHARLLELGPLESARWMAEQGRIQEEAWTFFMTIYAKRGYKSFSMSPDSFWRIEMIAEDGKVVGPTEIKKLSRSTYDQIMYPHLDRWSDAYIVRFPKVYLGKQVSLKLLSIAGKSELTWKRK